MIHVLRAVALAVAGAIAFASLAPTPVGAAGGSAGTTLKRRIVMLEKHLVRLEEKVLNAPVNSTADVQGLDARVDDLEAVTQLLDMDGTYVGFVDSVQVWSRYCEDGEPAVWVDHDGYTELSCKGS